jgi:sugar/nucleoside kinase (ribokinase family)
LTASNMPGRHFRLLSMKKFRIAVIGTINRDSLVFPDGERHESFGGIFYSLSALSALGKGWMEIYPVCNLGHDVYHRVVDMLGQYDNVRLEGMRKVKGKNNHVLLLIDRNNERVEVLKNRVPAVSFDQIKPFLDSDVLLVNFTSGFDLTLRTLTRIRANSHALMFLDIHSLTLGVRKNGKRFLRRPARWAEYLSQADIVQCNRAEFGLLAGREFGSADEIRDFGGRVLGLGPGMLLVTLGGKGAVMMQRQGRGCKLIREPGRKVRVFKDATGCGDAFSAGFISCYLRTRNPNLSLAFANRVGAEKGKTSGVEGVHRLLCKFDASPH